jgi:hypothetical protein
MFLWGDIISAVAEFMLRAGIGILDVSLGLQHDHACDPMLCFSGFHSYQRHHKSRHTTEGRQKNVPHLFHL